MENIELVKVVNKDKKYLSSDGKERVSVNYYVVCNGTYIAVRPSFSKGYYQLDMFCKKVVNG